MTYVPAIVEQTFSAAVMELSEAACREAQQNVCATETFFDTSASKEHLNSIATNENRGGE